MATLTLLANNTLPMFKPAKKDKAMTQRQEKELSIFDVKELYDAAYMEKEKTGNSDVFQDLMAKAIQMDMDYRRQLATLTPYRYIGTSSNESAIINTTTKAVSR